MRPDHEDKQTAISAYEKLHQYILNFCNDKNCLGCPFSYGGAIGKTKKVVTVGSKVQRIRVRLPMVRPGRYPNQGTSTLCRLWRYCR